MKTYFYKLQNRSNLNAVFSIAIVSAVSFYFISLDEKNALHMDNFKYFYTFLAQNTTKKTNGISMNLF